MSKNVHFGDRVLSYILGDALDIFLHWILIQWLFSSILDYCETTTLEFTIIKLTSLRIFRASLHKLGISLQNAHRFDFRVFWTAFSYVSQSSLKNPQMAIYPKVQVSTIKKIFKKLRKLLSNLVL